MPQGSLEHIHPRHLFNLSGFLTLVRLPLAVAFPFCAHRVDLALIIILLAAFTDAIDGPVAKWLGTESHAGGFADGWVDKIFNINVGWTLVLYDFMPWWAVLLLFTREWIQIPLVPYYVTKYCRGILPENVPRYSGKMTSVFLVISMCSALLGLSLLCMIATAFTAILGLESGIFYLKREFEFRRDSR